MSHTPEGAGPAPAGYEPPLALHIVWHPRCAVATEHARSLFAHLFEDPDDLTAHGLRVPVRLWRSTSDAEAPPPTVPPLHEAARNAVVVLIDDELIATEGWLAFLDELAASMRPNDALLGVALTETALAIDSPLLDRNMIRLYAHAEHLRRAVLVNRVTHTLCRLAAGSEEPVRVFVSHAKIDGLAIAQRVRAFLHGGTGIGDFFDAQDLIEGSPWAAQIRGAAAANVLLAVRTDRYASREWCRTEVLQAKLAGSPVIVLDALEQLEARGFPYLGNAPCVRWHEQVADDAMEELLSVILRETLAFRYFPSRVAAACRVHSISEPARTLPAPPELLTVLGEPHENGRLVYPDPPLGTEELALVRSVAPTLEPVTPNTLIAQ